MNDKFDISLSNTNKLLDLNNSNDASNIDMVLSLIVDNKENQDKLKDILENTSFKYLRRLQDDGLITDKGGPGIVPIYNPKVLEKAIKFRMAGGYSSLLEKPKSAVHFTYKETIMGDKIQNSSFHDFKSKTIKHTTQTTETRNNKLLQWIVKWWWAVVVPLGLIIAGLIIEYKWFK
jgi:hypothetical protein